MIAIYSNNYITDFYIDQLKFHDAHQVYHSIDQYQQSAANVKLAFVNHINSYEPSASEQQRLYDVIDGRKFSQEIGQVQACSNLVFAFDNEIHSYHLRLFQQHQQPNVFWAMPGQSNNNLMLCQDQVILWHDHFAQQSNPYRQLGHKLAQLEPRTLKPMCFDALLGQAKPHRDFVHNLVQQCGLQHQILMTYMNRYPVDFQTCYEWEPDIEQFDHTVTRSTDTVLYQGQQMALCRILPVEVYNRTAYSLVAETGTHNDYSFFTEKTAKPILARRLFVMFSGRGFLQNLRSQGFKTFDHVIDESYDLIYNEHDRWSAAFEQVKKLCEMDQQQVFEKIAPVVEHNYNLLMNTDWTQHMLTQLQEKINNIQ
jgi:hypothetical protein